MDVQSDGLVHSTVLQAEIARLAVDPEVLLLPGMLDLRLMRSPLENARDLVDADDRPREGESLSASAGVYDDGISEHAT